ncbi:methyltransferase domain-containing protein [Chitinophaga qingshengii]|uniref:Methyltransferase domain-containing protein n=1 Tax=Chitinophaga qingshengii TaxID=1569794 RepID=A0ABR7TYS8_9BACT|nr:methyltransferase domain-containing protein [Chitinophaga qingshengii]MBC9934706.1 methyltransferase domain-containing protein [Chitinophaga qingshengii]
MKLLSSSALRWSPVVANNRMNRKRQASGINSYEKELHFKPETYLNACLQESGQVKWLDLCCGEGNALLQYARTVEARHQQQYVHLKGIDLVDQYQAIPADITCVQFETRSLDGWTGEERYDLITCIHGLHYVGDKLSLLAAALRSVSSQGLWVANLDLKSIRIEGDPRHHYLKKIFSENDISYNSRRKLISCKGTRDITFAVIYQGADDKAGPNYTGQEAVDSYYVKP